MINHVFTCSCQMISLFVLVGTRDLSTVSLLCGTCSIHVHPFMFKNVYVIGSTFEGEEGGGRHSRGFRWYQLSLGACSAQPVAMD